MIVPIKLITTEDGSSSLLREDMNETYHSFHGALGESTYVYILQGLDFLISKEKRNQISILEIGFGTGLNVYLAALWAEKHGVKVDVHTLEPIPIQEEIYRELNYADDAHKALFMTLHESKWEESIAINDLFTLLKHQTTLEAFEKTSTVDVIFYDAFAPSKQPEIWSLDNLKKCFTLLSKGGALVTYCAQGKFKRDMKEAGFEVQVLKGALGKKEMVRGVKSD